MIDSFVNRKGYASASDALRTITDTGQKLEGFFESILSQDPTWDVLDNERGSAQALTLWTHDYLFAQNPEFIRHEGQPVDSSHEMQHQEVNVSLLLLTISTGARLWNTHSSTFQSS